MTRISIAILAALLTAPSLFAQSESSESGAKEKDEVATPFGSVKKDEKAEPQPRLAVDPNLEVEADGENIIFIRRTPFGSQRWTKSRGELSSAEKALVEKKLKPKTASAEPGEKGAK